MIPRACTPLAPLTLLFASLLLSACSVDESLSPVPTAAATATDTQTATTTTTTTTTPPDLGPIQRTVTLRSPLPGPANNLLFDGDFEMSVSFGTGQYGWRMFDGGGTGEKHITVETGALCRSGLTCVKVHRSEVLLGRGTAAANGKGHVMELWARLPEGVACNKIQAMALECDTLGVLKSATAQKEPEAGWCHYTGAFNPSTSAVCMYIQTSLPDGAEALLDSALIGPNDGTVPLKETLADPVDPGTLSRLESLGDYIRRTTRLGPSRPPGPSPQLGQ